ncbi:hypothetical protein AB0K12_07220 [Nonomuraea sp. NPDC049419]|uniref:hypothetical protein n=1 Tax=Nonomuraea sp. NPDC049419 TaxID=3155772 RepID=UPI003417DA32
MEVESSICLSDLVPALRWSRPQQVAEALGDPRLPAGWWHSLPLPKALGMTGLDWICERLARLASSRWDHLPLSDLLPALTVHHIDPALPGWPDATRTAITGLGGWQRLRRLSPSDLGTPSATPEVVIGSVFREILGRIPAQPDASGAAPGAAGVPGVAGGHPEVTRPLQRGQGVPSGAFPVPESGPFPAQGDPAAQPLAAQAGAGGPSGPLPAPIDTTTGRPQTSGPFAAQGGQPPASGQSGPFAAQEGQSPAGGSFAGSGTQNGPLPQRPGGSYPGAPADGDPQRPGTFPEGTPGSRQTGSFPAVSDGPRRTGTFADATPGSRQTGSFPAVPDASGSPQTGSFAANPDGAPGPRQTGSFPAASDGSPGSRQTGGFPAPSDGAPGSRQSGGFPAASDSAPGSGQAGNVPGASDGQPGTGSPPAQRADSRTSGSFPVPPGARSTGSFPAVSQPGAFPGAPADGGQQRRPGTFPEGAPGPRQTGSFPAVPDASGSPQTGSFAANPDGAPGPRQTGNFPAASDGAPGSRQTGSFPAASDGAPGAQQGGSPAGQDPAVPGQNGALPGQGGAYPGGQQGGAARQGFAGEGLPQRPGQQDRLPQRPTGPQSGRQDTGSAAAGAGNGMPGAPGNGLPGGPGSAATPAGAGSTGGANTGGPGTGGGPGAGGGPGMGAGGPGTGSLPAIPGANAPGSGTNAPGSGANAPGSGANGPGSGANGPGPGSGANTAVPGTNTSVPGKGTPAYAGSGPVPHDPDHAMVRVVDNLFRNLDKLELAVAQHRLFAEDPVSLRTLAHKMLVEREALSLAQRTAEERVLQWLRSSESAPVTGHMFRLTEWLGAAATEDQLIGADPAHPVTVPSLRTPLWRVLVTLMPDRRLQDGWLVVGDMYGLQARTRQLLASAPPDADVVELMSELGIRAHSAKAWLDALPPETSRDAAAAAPSPAQPLPRRTPGANGHHHRGGQPIPPAAASSIDPSAALATLSALSGGRSPMLSGTLAGTPPTPPPPLPSPSSDPRRWQRIEVTPEHLRGGPVPVPEGYAAQLGMRPGTLLSVTGPGDNAIVLVWQGHQPVFDSLQPVLMRLNARPGDQVYVTVDGYRLEAQLTG